MTNIENMRRSQVGRGYSFCLPLSINFTKQLKSPENSQGRHISTQDYLKANRERLSPEELTHHFNNDLNTASTALDVVYKELGLADIPHSLRDELQHGLSVAQRRLSDVHEVGNIALSKWAELKPKSA